MTYCLRERDSLARIINLKRPLKIKFFRFLMALNKAELCSSLCSCPLLLQMQENFVKKFKVYPNQGEMVQTTSNFKDIIKALELPNKQNNENNEENEENLNLLYQPEISNLWHSFDEINNDQEEYKEEKNDDEDNIIASLDYKILNEESKTPIPVYETMTELELNLSLFFLFFKTVEDIWSQRKIFFKEKFSVGTICPSLI
ncbi:unnamed protein product [Meloidogyne enterolobii]|uniref:Uncharacterized protein n=2 Tax=Meloidogyne enterolobii TaxID=390850 RepID=A0ACB0XMZ2_MELEN